MEPRGRNFLSADEILNRVQGWIHSRRARFIFGALAATLVVAIALSPGAFGAKARHEPQQSSAVVDTLPDTSASTSSSTEPPETRLTVTSSTAPRTLPTTTLPPATTPPATFPPATLPPATVAPATSPPPTAPPTA